MKMPLEYSNVPMAPSHKTAPFCNREMRSAVMDIVEAEMPSLLELYRKRRKFAIAIARAPECSAALCYNSSGFQHIISIHHDVRGKRLKRVPVLLLTLLIGVFITSCGGGSGSSTAPPSKVSHRAFISNTYSGNLQVMDTQNDTTPFTAQTTNSAGQVIPGVPVTISVGTSLTFEVVSPGLATTLVYDQSGNVLDFVNNATEAVSGSVTLPNRSE